MKVEQIKNTNDDDKNNLQEDNNSLDEDDIKSSINDLLKNNKLAELQDKAKSLGIITTKMEKNKSKNKTKLELAKDIVNKKINNKIVKKISRFIIMEPKSQYGQDNINYMSECPALGMPFTGTIYQNKKLNKKIMEENKITSSFEYRKFLQKCCFINEI